ncbi:MULTISPECIES: hypothetical protein [unclassified Paenibacillus]|uniref:hypothetical protein n=1 Tax=unclassified Paenibacillus TaxID=185978 RepID=UPI0024058440|nr:MULTISPECIES: hypothetical protein [unclassified Paenibacillus]MDF9844055.1 hypothetical protein [Paenibacillus sp. PastF-2]MDF9850660.1 hypothetical protein [Paenibacillus sp. PastM-2]MDF9857189.1 hypothetical protein [Paenibacillus sp. PastF-1]MDH6482510.1 hypothetical protein [Paenibacillus sp. PastH-2]MDH6509887.1 hypothetical protein [Paenibacillus sp. PastM-3]
MKRWKKVLIWTLSVIVVLGVGGLFAANYAVDKLMNSMAGGFEVEDTADNAAQGEVVEPVVAAGDAGAEPTATDTPTNSAAPTSGADPAESTDKPVTGGDSVNDTTGPTSVPATWKPTAAPNGYTAQVSTDKAKDIQDNVTVKDKADVASIVMSQLSISDIKRLQELAKGGLTIEEKREARSIILGKVSEDQYNELSQIAKKYGVSQGKTQQQIIAEEEQLKAQEKGSE